MVSHRSIYILVCLAMLFLTSCSSKLLGTANAKSENRDTNSSNLAASSLPMQYRNIDINSQAATLSSTPGQVAISLIICKLDNSKVLEELVKKDAQTLFDLLNETALQKSKSLETLDEQYELRDILASLNIYVTIKSNSVTSVSAPSSVNNNWIAKFQTTINAN